MQGPGTSSCPGRPGAGPCSGPMLWGLPLGSASRVDKGPGHLWNQASWAECFPSSLAFAVSPSESPGTPQALWGVVCTPQTSGGWAS